MKDVDNPRDVEAIARERGVSYSWFRKTFKEYTGISPRAQYQLQQRLPEGQRDADGDGYKYIGYRLCLEVREYRAVFYFLSIRRASPVRFQEA